MSDTAPPAPPLDRTLCGHTVRLRPLTLKARNRQASHGSECLVRLCSDRVAFDPRPGPWFLLEPWGADGRGTGYQFWWRGEGDDNHELAGVMGR